MPGWSRCALTRTAASTGSTLDPTGPTLRFERSYPHPIDKVWAAISDPEYQAVWFPQQILGERRAGARLRFVTSVEPDDGFDGEMIAYDPPRLIEMMWGRVAPAHRTSRQR